MLDINLCLLTELLSLIGLSRHIKRQEVIFTINVCKLHFKQNLKKKKKKEEENSHCRFFFAYLVTDLSFDHFEGSGDLTLLLVVCSVNLIYQNISCKFSLLILP